MYFDEHGLVICDQENQFIYIPWKHVNRVYRWILQGKSFTTYPGFEFTREEIGFIIANYEEEF